MTKEKGNQMEGLGNYWTTSKLAGAAGLDQSRIRQLILIGEIAGVKIANRWFIPIEEARRWLADRANKKTN